jgi:hypothetical protein
VPRGARVPSLCRGLCQKVQTHCGTKTAEPARGFPRNEREKKSHDSSFACHDRTRRGAPRTEARTRATA